MKKAITQIARRANSGDAPEVFDSAGLTDIVSRLLYVQVPRIGLSGIGAKV
jgi:hypothetical protein